MAQEMLVLMTPNSISTKINYSINFFILFPYVPRNIDFSSQKPLSEEMLTDLIEGESRRAGIILETKKWSGGLYKSEKDI